MIIDFNKINGGGSFDPTQYYTKTEIDGEITRLENEISSIDLSNYATTSVTSAISTELNSVKSKLETDEQTISVALNNLHNEIDGIVIPDVSSFVTSADVQTQIDEAISEIDLSGYATTATTDAIQSQLDEVERVTAIALTDLHDDIQDIVIPDVSSFVTSGDVQIQIDSAISGIDLSNYATTSVTSAISTELNSVKSKLETDEETISIALNDLHNRVSGIPTEFKTINNESIIGTGNINIQGGGASYSAGTNIDITNDVISVTGITVPDVSNFVTSGDVQTQINSAITNCVTSTTITSIIALTQSAYDALTVKDANTLYVITDSNN